MAKSANCSAVGVLTWSQRAVGAGSCPTQSTKPLKKEGVKRGGGIRARMKQEDQHPTPSKMAVIGQSTVMAGAMVLAALQLSLELTMASVVMIGLVLAPLGTHYSLVLDRLTPSQHRPEMFALLRTANALGVIVTSGTLVLMPISTVLWVVSTIMATLTLLLACAGAMGGL